jgi:hypothetical protein
MTAVAKYITKHGIIAPMENMRRHATFSSTEEKRRPEMKPSTIPMFIFEVQSSE